MKLILAHCSNNTCPDYDAYFVVDADLFPSQAPKCLSCKNILNYTIRIKALYPGPPQLLNTKCLHCGAENPRKTRDTKCRVCWGLLT
jgi:hypothetical protein